MNVIEAIVLGIAQGLTEWIPISSEGVTVLLGVKFFDGITVTELIRLSLYLHLGTFLAAVVYFKKEIVALLKQLFKYPQADATTKAALNFYVIATLISGTLGLTILKLVEKLEGNFDLSSKVMVIALGILLLITGSIQLKRKIEGKREEGQANLMDSVLTGMAQGLSVLPGFSRSGMTVATLLLRGFDDARSLKMSFILSLPIVLAGNILLNAVNFVFTAELFVALALSFLVGMASIHFLLKFAERIKFGYFVIFFGVLVIASALI
ncbi:MAG: undecaprenyl-diphosphate phosphatase [Candidatus Colwellbacteria bacterium]|nr:undecaprenyl-diphosphate phosphatase [Candidatus Colwellbacteria bacterium]